MFCFDNYGLIHLSQRVTLSSNVVSQSVSMVTLNVIEPLKVSNEQMWWVLGGKRRAAELETEVVVQWLQKDKTEISSETKKYSCKRKFVSTDSALDRYHISPNTHTRYITNMSITIAQFPWKIKTGYKYLWTQLFALMSTYTNHWSHYAMCLSNCFSFSS